MKKNLFSLLFVFKFLVVSAQTDFRPGYIITDRGDSIAGLIATASEARNSTRCVFKNDSINQSYSPTILRSYHLGSGKFYESKIVREGNEYSLKFVEVLLNGEKKFYRYFDLGKENILIDRGRDTVFVLPYSVKTIYSDGKRLVRSSTHKYFLKEYFKDCPGVFPDIENMVEPTEDRVEALVSRYYEICRDSSGIQFDKSRRFGRPSIGFRYSVSGIKRVHGAMQDVGVLFFFPAPRVDERVYFKTGLYQTTGSTTNVTWVRVPLHVEYLFNGGGPVSPKIDFGFNIYHVKEKSEADRGTTVGLNLSGGFLVKISKKTSLDMMLNVEPLGVLSAEAGLYVRL